MSEQVFFVCYQRLPQNLPPGLRTKLPYSVNAEPDQTDDSRSSFKYDARSLLPALKRDPGWYPDARLKPCSSTIAPELIAGSESPQYWRNNIRAPGVNIPMTRID